MSNFVSLAHDILVTHLDPQHAGLALGITFGTKLHISPALQEQMRIIGAGHLLVLSGGNIGMLGELLEQVLFFIPSKVRTFLIIVFIVIFILNISIQGSVIRATIMYTVPKLGDIFGKRGHKMYTLFLTLFAMLAWDINYLNDISFSLSFAALFGIFLFEPKEDLTQRNIFKRVLAGFHRQLHIGISAQTFILPLIFYHFNSIAALGVVSTLIISGVIAPIMACTIMLIALSISPFPLDLSFLGQLLTYLLTYVEWVASNLASLEFLHIQY